MTVSNCVPWIALLIALCWADGRGEAEKKIQEQREIWNEKELSSDGLIARVHSQNGLEKAVLYATYAYRATHPGEGVRSGHMARAFFWNVF